MTEIHLIDTLERPTLGLRRTIPTAELPGYFESAFHRVMAAAGRSGAKPDGPPYARYRGHPTETVDVEAGFPLVEPVGEVDDDELVAGSLPAGRVAEAIHTGSYEELSRTYDEIAAWAGKRGHALGDDMWEFYEAGPESDPDPATWRTRIVCPLADPSEGQNEDRSEDPGEDARG